MSQQSIAVLGTGIMGAPIARNLAKAGFDVRAWNRTRAKADPLAADGVSVSDDIGTAVAGASYVVTMLADGAAVRSVVDAGLLDATGDGAVWLQMSTVGVEAGASLAAVARDRGVAFVDCPVLGTRQPAEQGQLQVLAAGDPSLREGLTPVFDAIGRETRWVGDEPGAASAWKLVMNSWVLALTDAVAEALALAQGLGFEPQMFLDAIKGGPLDVGYAQLKGGMMVAGRFDPAFPAALAAKDAGLVVEAAEGAGVSLSVAAAVRDDLLRVSEDGYADEDMAAVWRAHAPRG